MHHLCCGLFLSLVFACTIVKEITLRKLRQTLLLHWFQIDYAELNAIIHDFKCSDFVTNSYGESWDSSCEKP